jgi:hypothetical protein
MEDNADDAKGATPREQLRDARPTRLNPRWMTVLRARAHNGHNRGA